MGLKRLLAWIGEVLERPADCSNVAVLPPEEYVHMARKLLVKFTGPPAPSAFSPRASFSDSARRRSMEQPSGSPSRHPLSPYLPEDTVELDGPGKSPPVQHSGVGHGFGAQAALFQGRGI